MPRLEIVIATRNPKKARELARLMRGLPVRWRSLQEFPDAPTIREDGRTFRENAIKKALLSAHTTKRLALADDSGLLVKALGNRPGVRSARFAGRHGADEANNLKVLRLLRQVRGLRRAAAFSCVLALADPRRRILAITEGHLPGLIALQPQGRGGFGYDPIFWIPRLGKTAAQLSLSKKNQLSHRAQAARRMRTRLVRLLPSLTRRVDSSRLAGPGSRVAQG